MSVQIIPRSKLDVDKWDELIADSQTGTVQSLSWYIDVLTEGKWQACVSIDDGNGSWQGGMPLFETRKMGNIFSRQPMLSKYWGVHLRVPANNTDTYPRLHHYKKVSAEILKVVVERAKVLDYFTGIEPAYSAEYLFTGLNAALRVSYMLDLEIGLEALRKGYSKTVRKRIRKLSQQGFHNKIVDGSKDLEQVLLANKEEGTMPIPSRAIEPIKALSTKALEKGSGFFLSTYAENGDLAAAGFFVHDKKWTHFISGYVHPVFRKENAMTLLVDGALEEAQKRSEKFDFFGSSIESIEAFFRSFGPSPVSYYRIIKAKFPFSLIWKG